MLLSVFLKSNRFNAYQIPKHPESHKNVCRDEWNAIHASDYEEKIEIEISFGTDQLIPEGDYSHELSFC